MHTILTEGNGLDDLTDLTRVCNKFDPTVRVQMRAFQHYIFFLLLTVYVLTVVSAPYRSKSKSSSPVYDQKQTGDYNIQLHLKDFQVVALLNDGFFSDFGEYDYNYDYSDITIKPHTSTSTLSPPISITTTKPDDIFITTKSPEPILSSTTTKSTTVAKQQPSTSTTTSTTTELSPKSTKTPENVTVISTTTTQKSIQFSNGEQIIPVQVISASRSDEKEQPSIKNGQEMLPVIKHTENLTVVEKDPGQPEVQQRKCAVGFTRDKQGRCRRVRRPASQLPFGITHLASLASKLRQSSSDIPHSHPQSQSPVPALE